MKKKEMTLKLGPVKFALAAAIIAGAITFVMGIMGITEILSIVYSGVGYTPSFFGAFVGAGYVFLDVFILSWFFAWLYNKLL